MSKHREPADKWQRILEAAKHEPSMQQNLAGDHAGERPPDEFSVDLLGRVRAFHQSLAAWQRWSLLAGLVSIVLFIASLIYLKSTTSETRAPIIDTPGLDLPQPPVPTDR